MFLLMVQWARERKKEMKRDSQREGKNERESDELDRRIVMLSKAERLKNRKIKPKERLTERDENRD